MIFDPAKLEALAHDVRHAWRELIAAEAEQTRVTTAASLARERFQKAEAQLKRYARAGEP